MARIAIIVGHSRTGTFCEALGEAYREGATAAGHEAKLLVVANLDFDPILRGAYVEVQPREPDLEAAYQSIAAADHLVFIFPLWLGDMPAILKGFLERLLQPELIEANKAGHFVQLFKGKSARVIVTMGMPGFVYRWWFGAHAVQLLKRNILGFMGVRPVRVKVLGRIKDVSAARRARWIEEARDLGHRAA
jgi:putative NADPH-quinone reductase